MKFAYVDTNRKTLDSSVVSVSLCGWCSDSVGTKFLVEVASEVVRVALGLDSD